MSDQPVHLGSYDPDIELLPCPTCGADAAFRWSNQDKTFTATCVDDACGMHTTYLTDPTAVAVIWNRRTRMNDWIPCSERMPEEGVYVLVYVPSGATKRYFPDYQNPKLHYNEGLYVDVMMLQPKANWWQTKSGPETTWYGDDEASLCGNDAVSHWMPLPALPIKN